MKRTVLNVLAAVAGTAMGIAWVYTYYLGFGGW